MRGVVSVSLAVAILAGYGARAQVATSPSNPCSDLKFEISIPENTVRPVSEVLLETRLSNLSHGPVFLNGGEADWWSYTFDLRDSQGSPVPPTAEWQKALRGRPQVVIANVAIPIFPGTPLTQFLLLHKLFDLNRPGTYTIRVSSPCGVSNSEHFTLYTPQDAHARTPAISIRAGTTASHLPAGWALPLDIILTNRSDRSTLQWPMNDPPNTAPDETGMGLEVFDSGKKLVSTSETSYPDWSLGHFPHGKIEVLKIPPGGSAEQVIAIGNLFDIAKPGHYTARIALLDPTTNQRVESNPVPFEVVQKASATPSRDDPQLPPFIVTLRSEPYPAPSGRIDTSGVLICMSNISDHDIQLDNASSKDYLQIQGPDGKPAMMTEAAKKGWPLLDPEKVTAGSPTCCNWTVKPRKALCGGIYADPIFDLSRAGTYRIRVDRYDEPDATPGQKFADLPVLHSNWLEFAEPVRR